MKKPKLDIGTQSKEVGTHEGSVTISFKDLNDLYKIANQNWAYKIPFQKIAAIVGILAFCGSAFTLTWKVACWKTKNECKLQELENMIEAKDNGTSVPNQVISHANNQAHKKESPHFIGQIGIIKTKIRKNKLTSFNLPYLLSYNVCEYNDRYVNWNYENPTPKPLFFYQLISPKTHLSSWCIVIGRFKSTKYPNRVFLVSMKVANELGFSLREGVLDIDFKRMDENEWNRSEECCNTRNIFFSKKGKIKSIY